MRRDLKMCISLGAISILLAACGTTRGAQREDKVREDFKLALAERQVARRKQTAKWCLRRGVVLPEQYRQKGGGMLEDYVPDRPPCGIPAHERAERAEADFRTTWQAVVGRPVPFEYEWLLSVKGRIATWLDAGGLTPNEARRVWREARWFLAGREAAPVPTASTEAARSPEAAEFFVELNRVLEAQGIFCRRAGQRSPCF